MSEPKCLICHKVLKVDPTSEHWGWFQGGDIIISFGYGSRHDQLRMKDILPTGDMDRLLQCDEIRARICDSCFEERFSLCEGYNVTTEKKIEKVI
jgi:hypothetical protein